MIVESITPIDQPPHHTALRLMPSRCMLSMRKRHPLPAVEADHRLSQRLIGNILRAGRIVKPVKRNGFDVLKVSKFCDSDPPSTTMMVWSSAVAFLVPRRGSSFYPPT